MLVAGRLARSVLVGLEASVPLAYLFAAGLIALVALAASWLPPRRAAALDPMVALRPE
ncbi:MAG TPA: hypothetical protein VFQ22_10170 [Longimicrobiales bacterium]|nr:hypothetical protein [Longimicrobiales bacterium]